MVHSCFFSAPGYLTFYTSLSRQACTSVLRHRHFSWSWVIGVLYRHKIHTYATRWAFHPQRGSKG